MDIRTAFRLMVAHIPGTWETAARLCGKNYDTVFGAWSERETRFVPSAVDAEIVSQYAISLQTPHCYAYAQAVAENAGGRFDRGDAAETTAGAKNLPADTAALLRECSDVVTAVTVAMADGALSQNDRKAIRKELLELADAMQRVDGDVDADERAQLQIVGGGRG